MEDEKQIEQDRQRAEVFDALGHPTRILILKVLSEGVVGFADLKKKTAIESGGHLQHHLTKLDGLIKTDEYGKYCLSDQGRDALLMVQTVESSTTKKGNEEKPQKTLRRRFNPQIGLKPVAFMLVALLIASSAIAVYEYQQTVSLSKENIFYKEANPEAAAYLNEYGGVIPITNVNSSFAPPISMYQALTIGFTADGWNKTSLQDVVVSVNFVWWKTVTNITLVNSNPPINTAPNPGYQTNPSTALYPTIVTSPPTDYSDFYSNGVIYQYVWQIDIQRSSLAGLANSVVPGQVLVDASTGQIVPNCVYVVHIDFKK